MADIPALSHDRAIGGARAFFLAVASGLIVANLYYAQPLAGMIGEELGMAPESRGLIVTFTQLGYALGLVLIVPLGDLLENASSSWRAWRRAPWALPRRDWPAARGSSSSP